MIRRWGEPYKGQTAVVARSNLGLVRVDVDLGMPRWPAAAVAGDDALVRPPHRLLVDELNGRVRLWLFLMKCPILAIPSDLQSSSSAVGR